MGYARDIKYQMWNLDGASEFQPPNQHISPQNNFAK